MGFDGYAIDFIDAPDPVKEFLESNGNLHRNVGSSLFRSSSSRVVPLADPFGFSSPPSHQGHLLSNSLRRKPTQHHQLRRRSENTSHQLHRREYSLLELQLEVRCSTFECVDCSDQSGKELQERRFVIPPFFLTLFRLFLMRLGEARPN